MSKQLQVWILRAFELSLLLALPFRVHAMTQMPLTASRSDDHHSRVPADGGQSFDVPAKPAGCSISLDAQADDWLVCVGALPTFGTGAISVTVYTMISHVLWKSTGFGPDTLYMYIGVSGDGTRDAADAIVLMLDTQHGHVPAPTNLGFCFKRGTVGSGTIERITTLPTNTCSPMASPPAGRVEHLGGNQWAAELKLVPGDFGLASFSGTVGAVIRVEDATTTTVAVGPGAPSSDTDPQKWAHLDLQDAVDVALVLDYSGSMNDPCPVSTCTHKIDVLKNAVTYFIDNYRSFAWQADQVAIKYFQSTVTSFPSTGMLPLLSTCAAPIIDTCPIVQDVKLKQAGGATAMGGGLKSAIDLLPAGTSSGRKSTIILFSDGMQNVNPMILDVPESAPSDGYPGGDLTIQGTATRLDGLGFKTHTIGIDATDPFITLMSNIANETYAFPQNTTDLTLLNSFFINSLVPALSSRSPQIVAYRRATLSADTTTEAFTVGRGITRIVLELVWPREKRFSFQVFKDGRDVTQSGYLTGGAFYRMFIIDPPFQSGSETITSEGRWELRIRGASGSYYEALALVDEPQLEYTVGTGAADYLTGTPIELSAELRVAGVPLNDATVTAVVGRPGEGIGTLLSLTPAAQGPSVPPEPGSTPAQVKLQHLLENPTLWQRIQPVNRTVQLRSVGNAKYTGTFTSTEIAGPYRVTFLISGKNNKLGEYRREQTLSTVVRFGSIDLERSQVVVRARDQTSSGQQAVLHFRPRDRYGNFLGPDFASQILVSLSNGTATSPRDLLDGGYESTLLFPSGTDPEITVTLGRRTLFQGKVSHFSQPGNPRFALSLHGGLSYPSGNFKNTHDQGWGATADLEYWWSAKVGLAALFGYHRFEDTSAAASSDLELFHGSAALEYRVTTGSPSLVIDAGGGYYSFRPGASDLGAHAGATLDFAISQHLSLGVNGRAHSVSTSGSKTTFYAVQAGGRYKW